MGGYPPLRTVPLRCRREYLNSGSQPTSIRLFQKDEEESEIDVLIETERFVWFVEAKFRSDVSERTTNNPNRDQVIRNLDIGTWYAGVRDFYFSLLLVDTSHATKGTALVELYAKRGPEIADRLPHRPDGLTNLKGIGVLQWSDLAAVLRESGDSAPRSDERAYANRAVAWLNGKGISG